MGKRGPIPKRPEDRLGHVTKAELAGSKSSSSTPAKTAPVSRRLTWFARDPNWHQIAQRWYDSLKKSGQAQYFEPSDVATAFFIAHKLSNHLTYGGGAMEFAALTSAMSLLLSTEGDRRRAGIELERVDPVQTDTVSDAVLEYQRLLAQKPPASEVGMNDEVAA